MSSLPWTPTPLQRHDLQWLVDQAGLELSTSQWPLPRSAVASALARLPAGLPPDEDAARRRLQAALDEAEGPQVAVLLRGPEDGLPGFSEQAVPGSHAEARTPVFGGGVLQAQAGLRAQWRAGETGKRLGLGADGSAAALLAGPVLLQAWSRDTWWGPGWQSSLILGHNTPALTGLGLQRASAQASDSPWLSWLGPWNFEFFVAQLDSAARPAHPYLVGNRLTFRPLPGLEIGLTRTAQWGGRGRDESLRSFVDLLLGAGLNATPQDAVEGNDPANALAGFDLRARCPTALRCSGYLQLIGEDEAGLLPSRYLGLYGFETWSADGSQRWFAELAETGARMPIGRDGLKDYAYRNYAYPGGYASSGRWLGSSFGPDSRVLTLGWMQAAQGWTLKAHVGKIGSRSGRFSPLGNDPAHAGSLVGLSFQFSRQWGDVVVEPELSWYRVAADQGDQTEARAGVLLRWGGGR